MSLAELDDIARDRWGRPLLTLPGKTQPVAFTRASTLSNAIESTYNLEAWKMRQVAIGLALKPDLLEAVKTAPDDKDVVGDAAEMALEVAGARRAAELGTRIHRLTEDVDSGVKIPRDTEPYIRRILAMYKLVTADLEVLAMEQFVACAELQVAGTFDRLVKAPNGRTYVADIKTGLSAAVFSHSASVQMAVYAHGTAYDHRVEPAKRWAGRSLADQGVDQMRGIMICLPQDGSGCSLHWVDLITGWEYAELAVQVRRWWKSKPTTPYDL